jgi:hypothetical protein
MSHSVPRALAPALMLMAMLGAPPAKAEEPVNGFVYTTDLLPQGKFEFDQWLTWRAHMPTGEFDVLEGRSEFEYGVSDRFQFSGYINYEWARAYHNNVIDGATLPPETLANLVVGPNERLNTTRFTGVSLEGIYRILSPYIDPVGLAVYVLPTVGPANRSLQTRLILQKNFFDDRLITAFNATVTEQWIDVPVDAGAASDNGRYPRYWDKGEDVNFGLSASYRFASSLSAGLEWQNEHTFAGLNPFDSRRRADVGNYFGPTIHYGGEHFFATLSYLAQMPWARDYVDPAPGFVVDGRNYSDDFERFQVRLKFGWYF